MRGLPRIWLLPLLLLGALAPVLAASCSSSSPAVSGAAVPAGQGGAAAGGAAPAAGGAGQAGAPAAGGAAGGASGGAGAGGVVPFVPPAYAPGPAPSTVTFPAAFRWAAASAGQQIESGLSATDWAAWAKLPGKVTGGARPDDGPDFWGHLDADVQAMTDAHLGAYRFSIEMARLYPTRDAFDNDQPDPDGVAKYDALLARLKAAGILPMVTLNHFAFPVWMSDITRPDQKQGWERDDAVPVFTEYARRMAARYGDRVDWWMTINEPGVQASVGYLAGIFPPGAAADAERMAQVMRAQVMAHARAYDAIHAADLVDADGDGKPALVSMAFHNRSYRPQNPQSPDDVAASNHAVYFWNYWYLNALVNGDFDYDFDERVDGPNDLARSPDLKGRLDFIGLNYYGLSYVSSKGIKFAYLGRVPFMSNIGKMSGHAKTDMDWDIDPDGFGEVIDQVKSFQLPIFITENGVAADPSEQTRSRFIAEHVFQVGWAIERGADLRGYTYWALTDNFEWANGFCPRFGLYTVDYAKPGRPRTPAEGRDQLRSIIDARSLTQAQIDQLPAYPAVPAKECLLPF